MTGTGFTVAVTLCVGPAQPFAHGVIVYTTVPFVSPSALTSNCEMLFPAPSAAPFTLVAAAVHVYVVPATLLGFVMAIEVDSPEQIV
jgi:hypothetical protein